MRNQCPLLYSFCVHFNPFEIALHLSLFMCMIHHVKTYGVSCGRKKKTLCIPFKQNIYLELYLFCRYVLVLEFYKIPLSNGR